MSTRQCGVCHRLRRLRTGVNSALALVVLAGSGLWVHQQATSSTLPGCGTDWVIDEAFPPGPPAERATRVGWDTARGFLTAPVTGIAYYYADTRGVGLCTAQSMTVAFVPSAATDVALTVGAVFVTGLPEDRAESIARHESRHVTQWAVLTLLGGPLALPVLYGLDEAFFPGPRNHFERAAGLRAGGYPRPADFGPKPQWAKATVIGLAALVALRRRLRWASRLVTLGTAGAQRCEHGRCPLHSRGWFQLSPGVSRRCR